MSRKAETKDGKGLLAGDAVKLWGGALVEQAFSFVRGIIMPRWLGPGFYGILGSLNMITKYGSYLQLGLTTAVSREVPFALAAGDDARARRLAKAVFSFNLLTSVGPALGVVLFALATWGRFRPVVSWGFVVFAYLMVTGRFDVFFTTLFRARRQFTASFVYTSLKAAVMFGAVVGLLYFFSLWGVYAALVFTGALFFVVGSAWTRTWAGPWPPWPVVKELLPVGLPLAGLGVLGFLLQSVDRLIVIRFAKPEEVGYYMLAVTIVTFIYFLPMNIGQAMAPRIFALRRDGDRAAFEEYLVKPSLILTYLVAVIGGVAVFCLIPFIRYVLPAFRPSVPLVAAFLVGITCQGGAQGGAYILVALSRFKTIALAQLVSLAFTAGLAAVALFGGVGLVGVAAASSVGLVVYACILQFEAWRAMGLPARTFPNAFGYLLLPPAAVAVAMGFAFYYGSYAVRFGVYRLGQPYADVAILGARLLCFAVPVLLFGVYVERQTGFIKRIFGFLGERLSARGL